MSQTHGKEPRVFHPHWPEGIEAGESYRVLCDDKGRNEGSWLRVLVDEQGDVWLSMQDWENIPEGQPSPNPGIRIRALAGGGRMTRTHQALLWLADAIATLNSRHS